MKINKYNVVLPWLFFIAVGLVTHANGKEYGFYTRSFIYGKDKESELVIEKELFLNKPVWNRVTTAYPPYNMSFAIKKVMMWANKYHSEFLWELLSVDIIFYNEIKGACVYIIELKGEDGNKETGFLSVGVAMDGEMIKPVIQDRKN